MYRREREKKTVKITLIIQGHEILMNLVPIMCILTIVGQPMIQFNYYLLGFDKNFPSFSHLTRKITRKTKSLFL